MNKALLLIGGSTIAGAGYGLKRYLDGHTLFDLGVWTFIVISFVGVGLFLLYVRAENE